jgi:fructose-1,6-bisphosphatase
MLNTEIDTIEEQNKTISNEIRKHEMKGDLSEKEKQQAIEDLKAEIDAANENMMAKEGKNKEMEDKLLKMQKNVEVG